MSFNSNTWSCIHIKTQMTGPLEEDELLHHITILRLTDRPLLLQRYLSFA